MKVAIGTTVLHHGRAHAAIDGIGTYCDQLISNFERMPEEISVVPFRFGGYRTKWWRNASLVAPFGLGVTVSAISDASHPKLEYCARECDLIHAPDHLIPRCRTRPVVASIMDAIPLAHPEWIRVRFRAAKTMLWRRSAQWADAIITISEHSKVEVCEWFGIDEHRVHIVPLGVAPHFFEVPAPTESSATAQALRLPERYFLVLGTIQPRKNVERAIAAHRALPEATQRAVPLVIAGRYGWGVPELESALRSAPSDGTVRWLEYVPEQHKRSLLHRATALVFPSLHEGFGLPALEAFACGTPLICSNSTALREIANQSNAFMFDPNDTDSITREMIAVLSDETLARARCDAGRVLAREYTWSRCARQTMEVYRKVL
jgi:glycosyltransferase involved in cell wall biosynthesis